MTQPSSSLECASPAPLVADVPPPAPPALREKHSDPRWLYTPQGHPRGYIESRHLVELWFHTGTNCNLSCPFCLEGSRPGDRRIERMSFEDAQPFIAEAVELGVQQFSFTGGEPFVNRCLWRILDHALDYRPCFVLTNGTRPLLDRLDQLLPLRHKPHPLALRISLDHPDPQQHDSARGQGSFHLALRSAGLLHTAGFEVSIARLMTPGEDSLAVDRRYVPYFLEVGLPADLPIVRFPDFLPPGAIASVPQVTEQCMATYTTPQQRAAFMCSFSRMVVKKHGRCGVYACTLVDDDPDFELGTTLRESLQFRVRLKHHRCYACFAYGSTCSARGGR